MKGSRVKIRVTRDVQKIFEEYRPKVGEIYDAEYSDPKKFKTEFCVVDIGDKRIVLRKGEFEVVV